MNEWLIDKNLDIIMMTHSHFIPFTWREKSSWFYMDVSVVLKEWQELQYVLLV